MIKQVWISSRFGVLSRCPGSADERLPCIRSLVLAPPSAVKRRFDDSVPGDAHGPRVQRPTSPLPREAGREHSDHLTRFVPLNRRGKTSNIQHPTSNTQWARRWAVIGCWAFDVGCWMFPGFIGRDRIPGPFAALCTPVPQGKDGPRFPTLSPTEGARGNHRKRSGESRLKARPLYRSYLGTGIT